MDTKLLLIAASTLAIAACGGAEVEDDPVATADAEVGAGTLASPDQPPLEGDSPFVDAEDVADSRLDQENYDTGLDGTDLQPTELTDAEPDLDDSFASTDLDGNDELFDDESAEIRSGLAAAGTGLTTAGSDVLDDGMDDMQMAASDAATTVTDGISAKQYTANNTDATIENGELITGSEAALLSGTYDVTLPEAITVAGTPELYIDGTGDEAVGTFAGEPIEVSVTGANFQFDAPVMRDGSEELMTFTGTFDSGEISNGVVEAQGDGTTMDWSAERTSEAVNLGTTGMDAGATGDMDGVADDFGTDMDSRMDGTMDSMGDTMDRTGDSLESGLDATGDAIEDGYDATTDTVGGAYDRATDGSDATEAVDLDTDY